MKNLTLITIALAMLASCQANKSEHAVSEANMQSYTVPDDSAITKAVHDAYHAISFNKGEQPRFDSIRYFFTPYAQLVNFRTDTAEVSNINQFVDLYRQFIKSTNTKLFYEEELFGRNEQYGRVAHRISTYVTYLNTRDSVAERGVNSFQLIKTPRGWKVSSIIWDVEKPSLKIPGYYLKK